ncbi:MAG: glutamate dehydrogenase, partial [Chloroflexi bacterium]|nr:glutamate dehydrogenase [Chloroflexota bacterium]
DLNRDHWSEEAVNRKLKEIMVKAFAETLALSQTQSVNMRTGAYLLAVDRVASATSLRGLYP